MNVHESPFEWIFPEFRKSVNPEIFIWRNLFSIDIHAIMCRFESICPQGNAVLEDWFRVSSGGALTTLLASYLHYICKCKVLVVDCDYPQWSTHPRIGYQIYWILF